MRVMPSLPNCFWFPKLQVRNYIEGTKVLCSYMHHLSRIALRD